MTARSMVYTSYVFFASVRSMHTGMYTSYVFVCVGQINAHWYTQVMCLFVSVRSMHTGIHKLCVCLCRSDQCTLRTGIHKLCVCL